MSTADEASDVQRLKLLVSEISAVHLHVRSIDSAELRELGGPDPVLALNAFVATLGLGYAGAPVRSWDIIANAFVDLFAESARFFTNGVVSETPTGLRVSGWYGSVTLATFEAGVVAADERRAGLLYAADED